ncbi:MAG: hypothetical protein LBT14_13020 [Treponema sp.]|jgi:hypothetical protein|nr:hypothetical protein [Treponema sp.]
MDKYWSLFWKLFGVALLVALVIGITLGILQHSGAVIYSFIQSIIAFGLGITGIIGLVVVPIAMYFEDRASRKGGRSVVE